LYICRYHYKVFSTYCLTEEKFQAYFGFTPSDHRKGTKGINSKNGKLFSKYGKELAPATAYNGTLSEQQSEAVKSKITRIQVVELPETHYCTFASTKGYDAEGIVDAWANMRECLAQHNITIEEEKTAGFCFDNIWLTPEQMCRYESAYAIGDINTNLNIPKRLEDAGISKTINDDILGRRLMI
jgi:AraC family transcriptional regulator